MQRRTLARSQRWLAGFSLLTGLKWTWIILEKLLHYICRKGSYFPNSTGLQGSVVIVSTQCVGQQIFWILLSEDMTIQIVLNLLDFLPARSHHPCRFW